MGFCARERGREGKEKEWGERKRGDAGKVYEVSHYTAAGGGGVEGGGGGGGGGKEDRSRC